MATTGWSCSDYALAMADAQDDERDRARRREEFTYEFAGRVFCAECDEPVGEGQPCGCEEE